MKMFTSKFDHHEGQPDEEQVEAWAEGVFESMLNLLNGFFCKVDVAEALSRMELVPFEELVLAHIEDESQEVKDIVSARVKELKITELEFMRAYV